jgi:hypothetical protein
VKKRRSGLVPLKLIGLDSRSFADAQAEVRISRVWPLVVGPVLVRHTRLLRVRHRTLVMGCWKLEAMASLRQSAEATWPQVQARLERLLGMQFQKLEVVPCDPPTPPPAPHQVSDPLESVLRRFRALRIQGWTPRPK